MKIVKRDIINKALLDAGFSSKAVYAAPPMDWNFHVPTRKWLSEFSASLAGQIRDNFGAFSFEASDCDDYSLLCMALARLWHRKTQTIGSLPVGIMTYTRKDGEKHMSLVAYADYTLTFIEPQNGEFIRLTQSEIDSCDFILL